ncbi:hypothetical protein FH972_024700 [Carpinus fangiana]|uniref:Uncharacterized protein n=1 Tax=Carpinus fangiana TaxID=176857 RepID=A0A5N6KYR4_9ROSI|nr:hypothetical protein FH972_024700 [Carpinus fangiana]
MVPPRSHSLQQASLTHSHIQEMHADNRLAVCSNAQNISVLSFQGRASKYNTAGSRRKSGKALVA